MENTISMSPSSTVFFTAPSSLLSPVVRVILAEKRPQISQNHRMTRVEKDLKDQLLSNPSAAGSVARFPIPHLETLLCHCFLLFFFSSHFFLLHLHGSFCIIYHILTLLNFISLTKLQFIVKLLNSTYLSTLTNRISHPKNIINVT